MIAPGMEHGDVRSLLPHGHPMVLIDRVVSLEPGVAIRAYKAVTGAEPCYAGLSAGLPPERYAYPTSLVIESFGQAAALLWLAAEPGPDPDEVLMLAALRDCRVERPAYPGDVLRHDVRVDHLVGSTAFVTGETYVGERRVLAVGSMAAVLRPTPR